jgi:hypothetical protein
MLSLKKKHIECIHIGEVVSVCLFISESTPQIQFGIGGSQEMLRDFFLLPVPYNFCFARNSK